jgi:hypothetical protein
MKPYCLLVLLFFLNLSGWSQTDSANLVEYDTDFMFTDGVYLSYEQVKKNKPLPKARIIANIDYSDPDFFDNLLSKGEFSFYDDLSVKQTVMVKRIWGFAKNGNLYIRMDESFNKVTYVGNICHFLATIRYTYQPMYDPYYYNPYYYYSGWNTMSVSKEELRQFIFDFGTGKIYDYEEKNIEILLMRDSVLHDEYMTLKKKKKQQLMFYYIRKFNERNPLKIPVYSDDIH